MTSTYNAIKDKLKDVVTTTNDIEELRAICHLLPNMVEELAESNRKLTLEVLRLVIICLISLTLIKVRRFLHKTSYIMLTQRTLNHRLVNNFKI